MAAEWPGNARELENVVSRAALRGARGHSSREPLILQSEHFDIRAAAPAEENEVDEDETSSGKDERSLRDRTRNYQRRVIEATVRANDGNWAAAARQLGMHRSNLHHLARKLGLR